MYQQQQKLVAEQERLSKELEECGEDMARMQVGVSSVWVLSVQSFQQLWRLGSNLIRGADLSM